MLIFLALIHRRKATDAVKSTRSCSIIFCRIKILFCMKISFIPHIFLPSNDNSNNLHIFRMSNNDTASLRWSLSNWQVPEQQFDVDLIKSHFLECVVQHFAIVLSHEECQRWARNCLLQHVNIVKPQSSTRHSAHTLSFRCERNLAKFIHKFSISHDWKINYYLHRKVSESIHISQVYQSDTRLSIFALFGVNKFPLFFLQFLFLLPYSILVISTRWNTGIVIGLSWKFIENISDIHCDVIAFTLTKRYLYSDQSCCKVRLNLKKCVTHYCR